MTHREQTNGAAHSTGSAVIVVDPAYRQAVRKHEHALTTLMPNYEKVCQDIAKCWRIDEVKEIDDKAEALRCYARQIHNHEAQTKLTFIRVRAWHRIGELSRSLEKARHGPGRGHKSRPGAGTPFKTATLRNVGISRTRANLAEQISKIGIKEFEDYADQCLAQGRPVSLEDMINTIVKRKQLRPGVRARPWSNNDEGLFGLEANGEKLSYSGRTYRMTKRLSVTERVKHIMRGAADLPERPWHPFLGWLFTEREVTNLLQDLSQRPIAEHEKLLHDLTKGQHEQFASVMDFVEVTDEHEQRRHPRTKKVKRRNLETAAHDTETQAAHQVDAR